MIIEQLKAGKERAYKFLYDRHYQILCHVAAQYVRDDFLAETIVGDVIFHLWEIREQLEIRTSIRSYLMQSVKNRCLDYLKSQYNQTHSHGNGHAAVISESLDLIVVEEIQTCRTRNTPHVVEMRNDGTDVIGVDMKNNLKNAQIFTPCDDFTKFRWSSGNFIRRNHEADRIGKTYEFLFQHTPIITVN